MKALGMSVSEKKLQTNGVKSLSPGRQQSFPQKHKVSKKRLFLENQVIWGNQVTLGLFLKSRDTVFKRRNFFLMPIEFL